MSKLNKLKYVLDFAFRDSTATGPFTSKTFERICYDGIGGAGAMQDVMFKEDDKIVSAIFYFGDFKGVLEAHRRLIVLGIKDLVIRCYILNEDESDNTQETLLLESEIVADAVEGLAKEAGRLTGGGAYSAMAAAAMAASTLAIHHYVPLQELLLLIETHYNQITGQIYPMATDRPRAKA